MCVWCVTTRRQRQQHNKKVNSSCYYCSSKNQKITKNLASIHTVSPSIDLRCYIPRKKIFCCSHLQQHCSDTTTTTSQTTNRILSLLSMSSSDSLSRLLPILKNPHTSCHRSICVPKEKPAKKTREKNLKKIHTVNHTFLLIYIHPKQPIV